MFEHLFANSFAVTGGAFLLLLLQIFWWLYLLKKPGTKEYKADSQTLVLYASQSGQAENLAKQTAAQLSQGNQNWQVASLKNWQQRHQLQELNGTTALFIVSTQGEGDPPDNAVAFFTKLRKWQGELPDFSFAVLGLGDSRYQHFCGFAHDLHQRLRQLSATALFDTVSVDNLDIDDLNTWQQQLKQHFMADTQLSVADLHRQQFSATLTSRRCENPNSPSPPLFSLQFELPQDVDWQGGDIAEVSIPTTDGEVLRSYTIANIPIADSRRRLLVLVRQLQKAQTATGIELGVGSGYLTRTLSIGESLALCIRPNPDVYLPTTPVPLLLIAAGSGLAGVLAVLQQAKNNWGSTGKHWLIFGERHQDTDTPCRQLLNHYKQTGLLGQTDYCFSRSKGDDNHAYVHDALTAQAAKLRQYLNNGAIVYVCGSRATLVQNITQALTNCLGEADYQQLLARNGLRFDVY